MFRSLLFFILSICFSSQLYSADVMEVERGPVHEAFITQEFGQIFLRALPENPPNPIQERAPERPDQYVDWLEGYWDWSEELGEFIWISGVWRRAPLEHHWIAGKWQKFDAGWVRLPGFWSKVDEEKLRYIEQMPPDALDESVPKTDSSEYFWVLGMWEYDFINQRFDWVEGRWHSYDEKWVYTPARYLWRGEGYLFIPGYWDWPIEQRGQVYASVRIKPDVRDVITFEPIYVIEHAIIIKWFLPYWPNYLYFYHTYCHFHQEFCRDWGIEVPWWRWNEWWCFTWQDQLALWWWWSHPMFPEPTWMDAHLAGQIVPPSRSVVKMMKDVPLLFNITPNGVVGNEALLRAIKAITGSEQPLLPQEQIEAIKKKAAPESIRRPILQPHGEQYPDIPPKKPDFGPRREELQKAPTRIKVAKLPLLPSIFMQSEKDAAVPTPVQFNFSKARVRKISSSVQEEKAPVNPQTTLSTPPVPESKFPSHDALPHYDSSGEGYEEPTPDELMIPKQEPLPGYTPSHKPYSSIP